MTRCLYTRDNGCLTVATSGGSVWLTHSVAPGSVVRAEEPELVIKQSRQK